MPIRRREFLGALAGMALPERLGTPSNAGVIATRAGLVFGGGGDPALYALDTVTGREVWRGPTGLPVSGTTMTYGLASGKQFVVVFSRQSGKDELLAQVLVWTLLTYADTGGTAVIAAPTLRPQGAISRDRLIARMREILPTEVATREGHIVELGKASAEHAH